MVKPYLTSDDDDIDSLMQVFGIPRTLASEMSQLCAGAALWTFFRVHFCSISAKTVQKQLCIFDQNH